MTNEITKQTLTLISKQITDNKIILYMKGTPNMPKCGFSAKVVTLIQSIINNFATVDVLENNNIRATLPQFANWPTFPQLYVDGELIGGCDIITEMYQTGELRTLLLK